MVITDEYKTKIYEQLGSKVLHYIQSRVCNAQIAEDLCADVFLKVYEKLDTFDDTKASISTWVYTIARNRLTDYYRTRRTFEEVPETLAEESSVEEDVCREEMLDALADALEKLDERERSIIVLRYYSGLTLKVIAERMGISYAYVKVLQNKALSALKTQLS